MLEETAEQRFDHINNQADVLGERSARLFSSRILLFSLLLFQLFFLLQLFFLQLFLCFFGFFFALLFLSFGNLVGRIIRKLDLFFLARCDGDSENMHHTHIHLQRVVVFDRDLKANQRYQYQKAENCHDNDKCGQMAFLLLWCIMFGL